MLSGNPILDRLPFQDIHGNRFNYMTVEGQVTQPLEVLSVEFDLPKGELGGAVEIVGNFALPTLIDKFMYLLFYGNPEYGVKGLHQLISPDITIRAGSSTGTALSHTKLNELLCNIQEPELIVSTPRVCASMMTYLQSIGLMGGGIEEYPAGIASYKTIPWFATNALRETEIATGGRYSGNTNGVNSSLFVLNFDALQGVHNGGIKLRQEGDKGYLTWLVGATLKDMRGCGKIDGIWPGSVLA